MGDSIDAAIVHNREVVQGTHGEAGKIGHMSIDVEMARACACGNHGCFQTLVSDAAFIRYLWPEKAEMVSDMAAAEREGLLRAGFESAESGDQSASVAVGKLVGYLGFRDLRT